MYLVQNTSGATCSTQMSEPRVSFAIVAIATAKSQLSWSPSVKACASLDSVPLLVAGPAAAELPAVPGLSANAAAAGGAAAALAAVVAESSSTETDSVEASAACASAALNPRSSKRFVEHKTSRQVSRIASG